MSLPEPQDQVVKEIRELGVQLRKDFQTKHDQNSRREDQRDRQIETIQQSINDLKKGFPDNDPNRHREYHEEVIRKLRARSEFWEQLLHTIIEKGVWAVLGLLLVALWAYAKGMIKS